MSRSGITGRVLGIVLAGALAVGLTPGVGQAQFANFKNGVKLPAWQSLPDWSGVWERDGHIWWDPNSPWNVPLVAPYNAEYMAKLAVERAKGPPPDPGADCSGATMPGIMTATFPMDLQVNPKQVTVMIEGQGQPRQIYTDGRDHPATPFPKANGHSVGEWKNGELHVRTCCLRDNALIPGGGIHSDALRIIERFYATDPNTLKLDITIDDPKAFTKPWTVTKTYRRRPDWEPVDYICTENNRNPLGADGVATVILAGEDGFNPPPSSALARVAVDTTPLQPKVAPGGVFGKEQMQRATAISLGNMAWEGVTVEDSRPEGRAWRWTATTPTGRWRCGSEADGTQIFCER